MVKQLNGGLTLNSLYMLTGVVSRQFTHSVDLYIVKHTEHYSAFQDVKKQD